MVLTCSPIIGVIVLGLERNVGSANQMNPTLLNIHSAFPSHLHPEVDTLSASLDLTSTPVSTHFLSVRVGNEILEIPYRIHLDEANLSKAEGLAPLQREIVFCIYTRHPNGRVREQSLQGIIASKNVWVAPYMFLLSGEYVREILELILQNLNALDANIHREFINANPLLYEKTRQRMISYWDYYYRHEFPNPEEYTGFKLFKFFDGL